MRTPLLLLAAASLLLATTALAPPAAAFTSYGYCIEGHSPCPSGMLVCVTKGDRALACAPDPCATANCFNAALSSVQCTEGLESYGVYAACEVGGRTLGGPVGCGACILTHVTVTCTEGTEGVGCAPGLLA